MITLVIHGQPQGKERPKFNMKTGRTYTPNRTILAENNIRQVWREAGCPRIEDDVAIGIAVIVTVTRPRSHFKSNGQLSALGRRHPVPRTKKPDLDNVVKLVMDALNSHAYRDDVRVARIYCERVWGEWASTTIKIWPMHDMEYDQ